MYSVCMLAVSFVQELEIIRGLCLSLHSQLFRVTTFPYFSTSEIPENKPLHNFTKY